MCEPAYKIGVKADFSDQEIANFKQLVCSEGRVSETSFNGLVVDAPRLITISMDGKTIGTAAIKKPNLRYRCRVFKSSDLESEFESHPYELGWIVVSPKHRGKHYSEKLVQLALEGQKIDEIYATSQTRDEYMHKTLLKCGFEKRGNPYDSKQKGEQIFVFLKK